jgi:hypothetical protein
MRQALRVGMAANGQMREEALHGFLESIEEPKSEAVQRLQERCQMVSLMLMNGGRRG